MASLITAEQASVVAAPAAGKLAIFSDNLTFPHICTRDDTGAVNTLIGQASNCSIAAVASAFATDTYLVGSSVQIPVAGGWRQAGTYFCLFDMVKTNAGTAAFTINVRMGTLGAIGDTSVLSLAFAVGTAAVDTGVFEVILNFRAVGAGTSAVIAGLCRCNHHLAATGLITTGASGTGIVLGTSAGFNSTTQTFLGISVNGGTSFSGTNTIVQTLFTQP